MCSLFLPWVNWQEDTTAVVQQWNYNDDIKHSQASPIWYSNVTVYFLLYIPTEFKFKSLQISSLRTLHVEIMYMI